MRIVKALESLDGIKDSIFLAGPSPRGTVGKDWRPEVIAILKSKGFNGTVITPVNEHFENKDYDNQVTWEDKALKYANRVLFWIPRSESMPAFTTNVEFGKYLESNKCHWGSPTDAIKNRYLQDDVKRLGGYWHNTIDSLVKDVMSYFTNDNPIETFITADLHLGEDRLEIIGRPFRNQIDMIEKLIQLHNSKVSPKDTCYYVGDICYQKTPEFLKYMQYFNGNKILVRGNHDRIFTDEQLKPYFQTIIPDGIEMVIEGVPCYINHYPTRGKVDKFNLVGHIHTAWKYQLNMFNVGIDTNHFLPVNLKTIPFHLNAITNYYDQDVWVAYKNINTAYLAKRGKSGTYFDNK